MAIIAAELAAKINITIENARLAYEAYLLKKEAFKRGWLAYSSSALIGLEGKEDIFIQSPEHLMEVAEGLNQAKAEHVAGLSNERNFAFLTLALFQRPWTIATLPGLGAAYSIITDGRMVRWHFREYFFEGTNLCNEKHSIRLIQKPETFASYDKGAKKFLPATEISDADEAALVMFQEWRSIAVGDPCGNLSGNPQWILEGMGDFWLNHCTSHVAGAWRRATDCYRNELPAMTFRRHVGITHECMPNMAKSAYDYILRNMSNSRLHYANHNVVRFPDYHDPYA